MRIIGTTIFLLSTTIAFTQVNEVAGTFSSVNNKFERWSVMTLDQNGTFIYSYGVGGCQAKVTGTFSVDNSMLKFVNDSEFASKVNTEDMTTDSLTYNIGTPLYPDLSLVDWKIGKNFIKPLNSVDSGCLVESGKHKLN
ncbi:hypothetical protein [Ekhidna sp.]|uniref:hypothetical protein n=1 Tax=Ekhidna sp. TaxID=2608089 RepID=UPI00329871B6